MPMIRQDKELQAVALELKACESVKGIKYTIETTKDGVVDSLSYFKLL